MEDKRIYVFVPKTVQVITAAPSILEESVKNISMVHGRLIAQGVHIGRILGHYMESLHLPYEDITTIVLSVRNSKELTKVTREVENIFLNYEHNINIKKFFDKNVKLYETEESVHSITLVGPVMQAERNIMDYAMGHLELY
jgi:hypothetical protein